MRILGSRILVFWTLDRPAARPQKKNMLYMAIACLAFVINACGTADTGGSGSSSTSYQTAYDQCYVGTPSLYSSTYCNAYANNIAAGGTPTSANQAGAAAAGSNVGNIGTGQPVSATGTPYSGSSSSGSASSSGASGSTSSGNSANDSALLGNWQSPSPAVDNAGNPVPNTKNFSGTTVTQYNASFDCTEIANYTTSGGTINLTVTGGTCGHTGSYSLSYSVSGNTLNWAGYIYTR